MELAFKDVAGIPVATFTAGHFRHVVEPTPTPPPDRGLLTTLVLSRRDTQPSFTAT